MKSKCVQKYAIKNCNTERIILPNPIIRNTRINTRITYFHITYFTPMWTTPLRRIAKTTTQPQALQEGLGGGGPEKPAKPVQC